MALVKTNGDGTLVVKTWLAILSTAVGLVMLFTSLGYNIAYSVTFDPCEEDIIQLKKEMKETNECFHSVKEELVEIKTVLKERNAKK